MQKKKRTVKNKYIKKNTSLELNRESVPTFWIFIFKELKNLGPCKDNANCPMFVL